MLNNDARISFVLDPRGDLVPPDIFLETTRCLSTRSAALLSEGMSGKRTKTNNSCKNVIARAASVLMGVSVDTHGAHSVRSRFSNTRCFTIRSRCCIPSGSNGSGPGHALRLRRYDGQRLPIDAVFSRWDIPQ